MRNYLSMCLAFLAILCLTGCPPSGDPEKRVDPPKVVTPSIIASYEKKMAELEQARQKAVADRNKAEELVIEREILQVRKQQSDLENRDLTAAIKAKDVELDDERTRQQQLKLYIFSGTLGFLALCAVGVSIFFWSTPVVRKWAISASIALGAIASLAIFVAWLLPYLWWIGGGVVLIIIIACLIAWKRDHKSLFQVAKAVQGIKDNVPNFVNRFNEVIDTDVDKHVNAVRKRLGEEDP